MYLRDILTRANFSDISSFILKGDEYYGDHTGPPEERAKRYEKSFYEGLHSYREKVLEYDWSRCKTEHDKAIASEQMFTQALLANGSIRDLYFEMGVRAGLQLGLEMQNNMSMTEIESEETYMSNNEYIRKVDDLGRVVLPAELRNALDWKERDALIIKQCSPTQIILKKAYPTCIVCGEEETLAEIGPVKICAGCRSLLQNANDGDVIAVEVKEEPAE